ncbi:MAG: Mor transcription activator family protein [Desulfomicrobium sp.]|nr:Mor transcription activator family protein [Desulfomicrobium sp.]
MAAISVSWPRLVDIIGKDAATALCKKYGGVDVFVPKKAHFGELPKLIGESAMQDLSACFGGEYIMLPNEVNKPKPVKSAIIERLEKGHSPREVAMEYKVTLAWVRRLNAQLSKRKKQRPVRLPLG